MAKKRSDYKPEDIMFPEQIITSSELVHEMKTSYIEYAMSVIVGRALPDVRDGLKPVHRRILYAMYEDGLTRDKPYRKCATAVGDVLGRYHPHGDASVYDALVRLAQDFSMRYPLIDGHGNFGSIDGDPPAAYRYTEARMSKIADEMLRDIEKDTVDWVPNFDETRKEPKVLPSRFPNLLVNGSSGIAVGMATNIPPHNLKEVINATIYVIDHPDATIDDLLPIIPGPDFPTKGIIMGRSGIRSAYETGKGHITVRARTEFEEYAGDRTRIVVHELPYQVNKRMLIANMAQQFHDKKLEDIVDIRDETDRTGMRIVIELKRGANAQVVLNKLFNQTQMQTTFAITMLALVDDQTQPRILSLKKILEEYIAFQKDIIIRRTRFDLKKAMERAHLLEGLLIAQENIDEVIKIIRNSYDNAKENLMARFGLSEIQASAILEMRLKALQGLEEDKLRAEYKEIEEKIAYYNRLLSDEELLIQVLKDELTQIRDKYGNDRLTEICESEDDIDIEDLIEEKNCVYTLTHCGYIKRQPVDVYEAQNRGGKGKKAMTKKEEDYAETLFVSSSHSLIVFFTNEGLAYKMKGYRIPEASRTSKGMNIVNLLQFKSPDEKVTAMIAVPSLDEEDLFFNMITKRGVTKRCPVSAFKNMRKAGGLIALSLDEGDELISVHLTDGTKNILVATSEGQAIRYDENEVSVVGRTARGVRAMKVDPDHEVVGSVIVDDAKNLLTITENGYGKRTEFSEFNTQHRGGLGVICHKLTEKTGALCGIKAVDDSEDVIAVSSDGILIRTGVANISTYGRSSQGVRVMNLEEGNKVIGIVAVEAEPDEEEDAEIGEDLSAETDIPTDGEPAQSENEE